MQRNATTLLALALILLGAGLRFVPHPANVAPIAATGLFAGTYLNRRWALLVPLIAMAASDVIIGFHNLVPFTWGSMMLCGVIGLWLRRRVTVARLVAGTLLGSVLFYLVTNWAVWQFTPLYARTAEGLLASYIAAIPFFRNSLLGDLFFSGALFGVYAALRLVLKLPSSVPVETKHSSPP